MILLRIDGIKAGGCTIQGGSDMQDYRYAEPEVGWFPIESASFGFPSESEAKSNASQSGSSSQNRNNQGNGDSGSARTRVAAPSISESKDGDPETKISIGKFVDAVTVTLMKIAMENKKNKKKTDKKKQNVLKADLHFLDSVSDKDDTKSRFVFPYMMIHIEDALIKNWQINAQGDERPQETLELWFDKVAMKYFKTTDGKVWNRTGCNGWDQHKNESWDESKVSDMTYFKDPKKT